MIFPLTIHFILSIFLFFASLFVQVFFLCLLLNNLSFHSFFDFEYHFIIFGFHLDFLNHFFFIFQIIKIDLMIFNKVILYFKCC
jgi:hypothetical protein